ncbi:hypothetical protein QUB60_25250 [Microcoleus sp. A2-C5]|uniref:hypothetical protein n=1 Tax=unclassified Microcoleus TaxID=2642155 RepID=UPI002FD60AB4
MFHPPHRERDGFLDWLAARDTTPVMIILTQHFTHFDNLIEVDGQTVRLLELPDNLIFTPTSGNGFNGGASGSGAVAVGGRCGEIG